MPKEVERCGLSAIDEPYTLYWRGKPLPLQDAEARVAFELVRFGQISIDRICLLAPLSEDGNGNGLAHNRISQIRRKLRMIGADVKIACRSKYGWELRAA